MTGSAPVPSEIVFTKEKFLNSATFNVYELWDDNDSKRHMRRLSRDFMDSFISSLAPDLKILIEYKPQIGWVFKLTDQKKQDEMIKQVSKFKPEGMNLSKIIQPELFDE